MTKCYSSGRGLRVKLFARIMEHRARIVEPNIVLLGFTCSGKTTVGSILARTLRRPFFDVDRELEQLIGPIPTFVNRHGTSAFRLAEQNVITRHMPLRGAVISPGAGSILNKRTRLLLCSEARVFYLQVPATTLARRLAELPTGACHRPDLLQGETVAMISLELARRHPIYIELGEAVDAEQAPEEVAKQIVARLRFSKGKV